MGPVWWGCYLRPDQFLDHLTVIKRGCLYPPTTRKETAYSYTTKTEDPGQQNPFFKDFVCLNQSCGSERKCFDTLSARRVPLCGGDFQSKLDFCTQSRTRRCFEKFFCLLLWLMGTLLNSSVAVCSFSVFFGVGKIFEKEEPVETREAGALWVQQQS